MKFKLFGIQFEISFIFTAVLALIAATDKTGDIIVFFVAALIHETAHLVTMMFLKSKPRKIKLIPGGINIVDESVKTPTEDILILLSGPVSNLICFIIFKDVFSVVSLLLFIYNMMPIIGLDGGRILSILISINFGVKASEKVLLTISIIFAILFILLFIYLFKNGVKNYSVLVFSLYLISTLFLKKGVERIR